MAILRLRMVTCTARNCGHRPPHRSSIVTTLSRSPASQGGLPPMGLPALALALATLVAAPADPRVLPPSEASSLVRIAGAGKPAVLHFWATWCGACREEFPRIRKTLATLQRKGVAVLLVSIDRPEDLALVKKD